MAGFTPFFSVISDGNLRSCDVEYKIIGVPCKSMDVS